MSTLIQTDLAYRELVDAAIAAMNVAFVREPHSHRFAAAVRTLDGGIYSAGNYFSSTYSLTIHAEVAALIHAAAHGEPYIRAIAVVSSEDPEGYAVCSPCGACRQLIFENGRISGSPVEVLLCSRKGEFRISTIQDLLPHPWPGRPIASSR